MSRMEEAGTQESLCCRPITGFVQLVYEEEKDPRLALREQEENCARASSMERQEERARDREVMEWELQEGEEQE